MADELEEARKFQIQDVVTVADWRASGSWKFRQFGDSVIRRTRLGVPQPLNRVRNSHEQNVNVNIAVALQRSSALYPNVSHPVRHYLFIPLPIRSSSF